jgi:hypothetical protein
MFLMVALGVGYALGTFLTKDWKPYAWCLPASCVLFVGTNLALSVFDPAGLSLPSLALTIGGTLLQTPAVLLGVYLAQRKAKRAGY